MTITETVLGFRPPPIFGDDLPSLLCWRCSAIVGPLLPGGGDANASYSCPHCAALTVLEAGIWRSVSSDHSERLTRFASEYALIRAAEGRGSEDPAYYLALPFQDLSGKWSGQWKIRARTFQHLEHCILKPLAARHARPLRILDLGAGNGWLSYRLSLLGHAPVAVDLLINHHDGLGAAAHFSSVLDPMFPRVQASLDRLPFPRATFDLAIFNASFHYSEDAERTLAEAMRCVCPGGAVILADTPWYQHEDAGLRMVEEKHTRFQQTYGFRSDSLSSLEFLTPLRLQNMASALGLEWQAFHPFYGIPWALRPLRARLLHRRPPSQFHIYMAEVPA